MNELLLLTNRISGLELYPELKIRYGGLLNPNMVSCLWSSLEGLVISFWENGKLRTEYLFQNHLVGVEVFSPDLLLNSFVVLTNPEYEYYLDYLKNVGFFCMSEGVSEVLGCMGIEKEREKWQEKWDYAVWSIETLIDDATELAKCVAIDLVNQLIKQSKYLLEMTPPNQEGYDNLLEEIKEAYFDNSMLNNAYEEYVWDVIFECYQQLSAHHQQILRLSTYDGSFKYYGDDVIGLSDLGDTVNLNSLLRYIAQRLVT